MGQVEGMFLDRGGHVSPSVSSRDQIWKLPPGANPLAFAGLVLTQVGYNCGTRAPVEVGEWAVVIGDGLVGQWAAQTLSWRGARVVLVGHHDSRLARFAGPPLRHTIHAKREDWAQAVRALAPEGVQVAVDTVGSIPAVERSIALIKRHGHMVSAGFYGTRDLLPLQPLRDGELSLDMVSGWSAERMNRTRELIAAGYLETLPLITHHFPVQQAAEAWQLIVTRGKDVLGVVLDW
jgi:2-desacetyl-2-hydroxyethyl bacteriochlorophyllide A dehydrogenase